MSMGGVEVLLPQDRLHQNYSMKTRRNNNPNFPRPDRRKKSSTKTVRNNNAAAVTKNPAKSLAMEQVKILKRGEPLNQSKSSKNRVSDGERPLLKVEEINDLASLTKDLFKSEPDSVQKQMSVEDFYAGFGFFDSPPPSSVPVPAFFNKKGILADDDPSAGLRRILGLDI